MPTICKEPAANQNSTMDEAAATFPVMTGPGCERNGMDDELQLLLGGFSRDTQHLCLTTRARVFELVPDAREKVMRRYKSLSYGFGGGMNEQFALIVLHGTDVNLQLHRATELSDPAGLLEGTGKAMRHVKIRTTEMVQNEAVKDLIESAAALSRP